ncbi:type II secretion system protein [Candidatus Nomurabacteria bacterium]|nr:type II secretion system protein [Candidatus Nomurabacteria bacterium]
MLSTSKKGGFTIVELLIVIVVIAILSAITMVVYSGVTKRTHTSSLQTDVKALDQAQKVYMALSDKPPIAYDSNGNPQDMLVFANNKGNSLLVKIRNDNQNYCIYGYNPDSSYPNAQTPLIRSSDGKACDPLPSGDPITTSSVYNTVFIIGQRMETFKVQYTYYPHVNELTTIGLVIKPNADSANQQQLYCRNDTNAIYLQIDQSENKVYVYDTHTRQVSEPIELGKLSLSNICPQFNIAGQPGYESTGIKNPDI